MSDIEPITLFHAPQSRSSATLTLLEELGVPYDLKPVNLKAGEQRQPDFLAVNPLGKVPAIRHRGQLVTEQVAIFIYVADLSPDARLAPAPRDPLRGPYLRWLAFYAASFEPAVVDKAMKRDPAPLAMSPYGDFDLVIATVENQLRQHRYLLGDAISAADILWGSALKWTMDYKIVPEIDIFRDYAGHINDRPAARKVAAQDERLAALHEASAQQEA